MKILFDLFPIILFFIAYQFAGIYIATGVAIGATVAQIAWVKMRGRKIDTMLWISFALIVVFGGATLWFRDPVFIKWKPTVLYWLFAVIFLVSDFVFKKNLMLALIKGELDLPAAVWRRLNLSWVAFFTFLGVLNLYVAYHYTEATWVKFKVIGVTALIFVFILLQGLVLVKYIRQEDQP